MEARDEKRLLRLQAQLAAVELLIVDELGYAPLSQSGSNACVHQAIRQPQRRDPAPNVPTKLQTVDQKANAWNR
jgi:DNA replication protein DnaC